MPSSSPSIRTPEPSLPPGPGSQVPGHGDARVGIDLEQVPCKRRGRTGMHLPQVPCGSRGRIGTDLPQVISGLGGHAGLNPPSPGPAWRGHPARACLERRVGRLLRLMRERELYRSLGFVRLGDYVAERLGFSYRTAQELMRTDAALEALPLAAAALEAAEVTSAHVRLLSRVAGPDTEPFWIGLARRMGVKEFARAVAAHVRGETGSGEVVGGGGDDRSGGDGCERSGGGENRDACGASQSAEETPWERVEIFAPAWVADLWRDSVTGVRRIAGSALPAGACFELVLAEAAGHVAGGGGPGAVDEDPERAAASSEAGRSRLHASALDGDSQGSPPALAAAVRRVGRCEAALGAPTPTGSAAAIGADGSPAAPDARSVDRQLRRLVTAQQRHDAWLADHLRFVARDRQYRGLGFSSLEEYASERFGLSARSLYYLLTLQRVLEPLPALRRAFIAGRLTTRQAILIGSVATAVTADAWVERAGSVTLRRLDDEVTLWLRLKESRPEVWDLLEGGPLPEGLVLAPGQPPHLHACARPARDGAAGSTGHRTPITAETFLRALEEDEAATPLPGRICRIRLRVEPEVREMWLSALAHLRATVRDDLKEWEALAILLREFWSVWDNSETRRQRRENPTLERDGWRCTAPGCGSVGTGRLHEHHIVFRSAGGAQDDPANTTSLCTGHHIGLLHEGKMRCSGRAPGEIVWEMGVEPGRAAFAVFRGETKIPGSLLQQPIVDA